MHSVLILYSTVDGLTLKICRRLEQIAAGAGHRVILADIQDHATFDASLFDTVVVGASIRYGHHRPIVAKYMRFNRAILQARRCAFFTVNIVARKPAKNSPATNPYMRRFLKGIGWRPSQLAVFAGKLDYPRYDFWDRNIIRFIMLLTRGPTDPKAVVEFTDWEQVDAFGRAISAD
ncbi:MAG: menaquinone-dependent protoporphyrinogen IX dehydrogenase [Betaproteobacteria bacterium]|nr:menaquinone-dependent protoporphyrinogen IX dehydrogenase [Betaproteobacteria bacterium]